MQICHRLIFHTIIRNIWLRNFTLCKQFIKDRITVCVLLFLNIFQGYCVQLNKIEIMAKSKKYSKISYEKRLKLIQMVCENGIPCVLAGKQLGISASTAKMIVKKFRENGEVFQKKQDKIIRQHLQEYKATVQNQTNPVNNISCSPETTVPVFYYIPVPFPDYSLAMNQFYN